MISLSLALLCRYTLFFYYYDLFVWFIIFLYADIPSVPQVNCTRRGPARGDDARAKGAGKLDRSQYNCHQKGFGANTDGLRHL